MKGLDRDTHYLVGVLKRRLADHSRARVLSDCLIDWGVRGLRPHSPDISVFEGVHNPNTLDWGTFVLNTEGGHPVLVIEIVSPDAHKRQARDNDVVTKVREYYRARVPLYLIVDQQRAGGPRELVYYRRGARRFVRVPPDEQGRVLLEPVRLLVGLRDNRVVCWDADTGEEIGDITALDRDRQAAEQGRQIAEQARQAVAGALAAETQARQAVQAALAAETQARQAVEATLAAQTQARQAETQARQATEAALAAAQARIRELEARPRNGGGKGSAH